MFRKFKLVLLGVLCICTLLYLSKKLIYPSSSDVTYIPIGKGGTFGDVKVFVNPVDDGKVTLEDIFISVRTSRKFHESRIDPIVKTWFNLAREQTYIFTDGDDDKLNETTGGHVINTHCGRDYNRSHLSCKTGTVYDTYLASGKKWWCRFDDDNYVNPRRVVHLVNGYNWTQDICIGKLSVPFFTTDYHGHSEIYQFAHGGAGCCISRPLALKMKPWCGREELVVTTREAGMQEDCALGFIITNRLKINLTLTDLLHSTRESLEDLNPDTLHEQASIGQSPGNTVNLDKVKNVKIFNHDVDPTRFITLHCFLFPTANICKI
uniref:Beta-1,3-N-acetylglucosaminyltransferase lunatic fringe n=1 Tax=Ciona intestinalis TaxID=7719 RepID=L7N0V1_CIOIN|nr:beta-1,3-N-acetylglucosaminyltransferase lunatic fringe [Ciona intestinalis]|eukprot:XP_018670409.1 beta-1,3-N-acetylglucosaminyltransferase lunatic fringe [Ciona intestinalis]